MGQQKVQEESLRRQFGEEECEAEKESCEAKFYSRCCCDYQKTLLSVGNLRNVGGNGRTKGAALENFGNVHSRTVMNTK